MGLRSLAAVKSFTMWVGLAALAGAAGCAHHGPPPRYPGAIGRSPASPPADVRPGLAPAAAAVVDLARALEGTPYQNGGTGTTGFDCSGLTQYVFARQGISLPRSVRQQWDVGEPVGRDEVAPGDLVFFSTVARGPSHVGIVVGEDLFVHAPSGRGVVRAEHLSASYWATRYVGARRLLGGG